MTEQKASAPNSEIDLGSEYAEIFENQDVYFEAVNPWQRARTINMTISFSIILLAVIMPFLPSYIFPFANLRISIFFGGLFIGAFLLYVVDSLIKRKLDRLENELGLNNDELLFIFAYETNEKLASYLKESNVKRRPYLRSSATKSAKEMVEIVEEWDYGNIGLTRETFGKQIDLFKNNLRRLVLANIAKGESSTLKELSIILSDFCTYLLSPSLNKLEDLNSQINKLPYVEYEAQTGWDRLVKELKRRPRTARFLFSSLIVAVVLVAGYFLNLDMGVLFAAAIASFWGSMAVFDKIFKFEKG